MERANIITSCRTVHHFSGNIRWKTHATNLRDTKLPMQGFSHFPKCVSCSRFKSKLVTKGKISMQTPIWSRESEDMRSLSGQRWFCVGRYLREFLGYCIHFRYVVFLLLLLCFATVSLYYLILRGHIDLYLSDRRSWSMFFIVKGNIG